MTADDNYSRHNRENLPLPIQMQLSTKLNAFYCIFIVFFQSALTFKHFETKISLIHSLSIPEIIDSKKRSYLNA